MVFFRKQLSDQRSKKEADEDQRAERISDIQCHREQVASGFPERRGAYLHHPDRGGDMRKFAAFVYGFHVGIIPARDAGTTSFRRRGS